MSRFDTFFGRLGAALLVVAMTLFMSCQGNIQKAGGSNAPSTFEEYKVLGRGTIDEKDYSDANRLEDLLNRYAKQGWKVRTAAVLGNYYIILAK
jgi:hypothetical protein